MELYSLITNTATTLLSFFLPQHYLHNISIFLKTLPRDLKLLYLGIKVFILSVLNLKVLNRNAVSLFDSILKKTPDKPCFLFEDQVWTFQKVADYSFRTAVVFEEAGLKKGDTVALFMTNRPEYCCIWLGLARLGVVSALVNSNLRGRPLSHCLATGASRVIIFSADLAQAVEELQGDLDPDTRYYQLGGEPSGKVLNFEKLLEATGFAKPRSKPLLTSQDHLLYVYTSGTTGLPKAAIVPHSRYLMMTLVLWDIVGVGSEDVVYDPLPLYHTAGGLFGTGAALALGATVVLKTKFSASAFIPDCARYHCTVAQYIGEICRYVLAVPEKPTDTQHNLRVIVGNGMKPVIWKAFIDRFKIHDVKEIYGSTEGNLNFVNLDNKIGAVGVIPRFLPFSRFIGAIIKVNPDTMEPIRGPDGFCIECAVGEPGMFVGIIPKKKDNIKEFHGYLDKKETNKKYLHDVFEKGDKAFLSGDLLVQDELGYLYFKDRTGDTFRWKGENVATSEVEDILSSIMGLKDCIVYGVQVGELEGRAGMAAIADPSGQIDISSLPAALDKALPRYAQPLFIRILKEIEITGTFKLKKGNLMKEGFDPSIIEDHLYFRKGASYIALTKEIYDQIISGKISV